MNPNRSGGEPEAEAVDFPLIHQVPERRRQGFAELKRVRCVTLVAVGPIPQRMGNKQAAGIAGKVGNGLGEERKGLMHPFVDQGPGLGVQLVRAESGKELLVCGREIKGLPQCDGVASKLRPELRGTQETRLGGDPIHGFRFGHEIERRGKQAL